MSCRRKGIRGSSSFGEEKEEETIYKYWVPDEGIKVADDSIKHGENRPTSIFGL